MSSNPSVPLIRAARASDVPALLELMEQYWAFEHLAGFDARRLTPLLLRLLADERLGAVWVAGHEPQESGGLAGYLIAVSVLSFEHGGMMAEVDELFVLPRARNQGLGAQLLECAEKALFARGHLRLQLQLGTDNSGARAFYERHGYRPRGGYQLWDKLLAADPFNLRRFLEAQEPLYPQVLAELRSGTKRSHWMWFIFPQIQGLGHSHFARRYALASLDEARAYLAHPLLGSRLRECSGILNRLEGRSAEQIFGFPDTLKFRSSMTLFALAAADPGGGESPFSAALARYFAGSEDPLTRERVAALAHQAAGG